MVELFMGVPLALQQSMQTAGQAVPAEIKANALIDTGATLTVVKAGILSPLNLHPVGSVPIATVGTPTQGLLYNVRVSVRLGTASFNTHLEVLESSLEGQNDIECLLGRDMLRKAVFTYIGEGNCFSLSF